MMIAMPIPASFFFFLARRFGAGLSTRVVIVVRVLLDVSAIAFALHLCSKGAGFFTEHLIVLSPCGLHF
jgi:hypothetical protein